MPSNKKKRGGRHQPKGKETEQHEGKNGGEGVKDWHPGYHSNPRGLKMVAISAEAPDAAKYERCFAKTMKNVPPQGVVERVRRGMGLATHLISDHLAVPGSSNAKGKKAHAQYLRRLVDAGLVSVVTSLLNRCEGGEEFRDVVEADGTGDICFQEGEPECRVAEPSAWLCLLSNVASAESLGRERLDGIRMEVARDVGPLVREICNDERRELFKSRRHWDGAIRPFLQLLHNLVDSTDAIPVLMNHEGLTEFVVRCTFWSDQRSDILEELEPYKAVLRGDTSPSIAEIGGLFIERVMKGFEQEGQYTYYFEGEGKAIVHKIGTTLCGCDSGAILVSGMVRSLKVIYGMQTALSEHVFHDVESINNSLTMLIISGCVDRQFIEEVVDLGLNHTVISCDAYSVAKLAFEISHDFGQQGIVNAPKDQYVATAIDAGLLDMLFKFLTVHGDGIEEELARMIFMNVQSINGVSLSKRTSKAIRSCRTRVLQQLESPKIRQLLDPWSKMAVEMLDSTFTSAIMTSDETAKPPTAGDLCNNCGKWLKTKSEKLACKACKRAIYCSRDCQVAHWKLNHKDECKVYQAQRERGGGAVKEKVVMMGEKFFEANKTTALTEITLLGCDVLDCIVVVDLALFSPKITVMLIEDHFIKAGEAEHFRALKAKQGECLGFAFFLADGSKVAHIMTFPRNWTEQQAEMRRELAPKLALLNKSPELRERCIADLKKKYQV